MPGLDEIPDEILLHVLQQATQGHHPAEKYPLLQVNKRFSQLAEPLLYRDVFVKRSLNDGYDSVTVRLISKILLDQRKAASVRTFQTMSEFAGELDEGDFQQSFGFISLDQREHIRGIIDHAFQDDAVKRKEWSKNIENGRADSWVALAIAQLTNLQVLDLQWLSEELWAEIDALTQGLSRHANVQDRPIPLSSLRWATFGCMASEYPDSVEPLLAIANISELRHLHGIGIGDGDEDMSPDTIPSFLELEPRTTNLTSIVFDTGSKLLGEHLTRFLSTPKALKSFHYFIGGSACVPFYTSELMQALRQQVHSLEDVSLYTADSLQDLNEPLGWAPVDFNAFKCLTRLSIHVSFLVGSKIHQEESGHTPVKAAETQARNFVPSTIEELEVLMCDDEESAQATGVVFDNVLQNRNSWCPSLRTLEAGFTASIVETSTKVLASAIAVGEEVGVTVIVSETEEDDEVGVKVVQRIPTKVSAQTCRSPV